MVQVKWTVQLKQVVDEYQEKGGKLSTLCKDSGVKRLQLNRYLDQKQTPSIETFLRILNAAGYSVLAVRSIRTVGPEK